MNDDISTTGAAGSPSPIAPAQVDEFNAVRDDINTALSDVDTTIHQTLSPIGDDVNASHSDVNSNINTLIGTVDLDVGPALSNVDATVSKLGNVVFNDLMVAETDVQQSNVFVPILSDDMAVALADPTGSMVLTAISGSDPFAALPQDEPMFVNDDRGFPTPVQPLENPSVPEIPTSAGPSENPVEPVVPSAAPCPCSCPPVEAPPLPPPPAPLSGLSEPPCTTWDTIVATRPPNWTICGTVMYGGAPRDIWVRGPSVTSDDPFHNRPDIQRLLLVPDGAPVSPPLSPPPPPPPVTLAGTVGAILTAITPAPVVTAPLFASDNPCNVLLTYSEVYNRLFKSSGPGSDRRTSAISDILRTSQAVSSTIADSIFSGGGATNKQSAVSQSYLLAGDWLGGYSQSYTLFQMLDDRFVPNRDSAWSLALMIGSARKAESNSSMPLDYLCTGLEYLYQSENPQYIPSQGELDDLYLQGIIAKSQWECWTKCHGNIPERRLDVILSKRPTMTPDELVRLENRGDSWSLYAQTQWERNRVNDSTLVTAYRELGKFVPGPGDLVRFMVRDSFDSEVVKSGQLDKDFSLKFYGPGGESAPGKAAQWARAQGMTEDQFRYYWYSHWQYPSNTALYEMLHRLRPDRPEVSEWDRGAFNLTEDEAIAKLGPKPQVMTLDDIRKIVEINDMAPAMVDPLLSVSYHVITRTDAIDAYLSGVWTEEQLYHNFRDNGYDKRSALLMVDIQATKAARRNNNLTGVWSIRKTIKAYQDGVIDGVEADAKLAPLLPDPASRQTAISNADSEVEANVQRARIAKLKRGYIFGAFDDGAINQALIDIGVTPIRARQFREQWSELKTGKYREPTARQILGWLKFGVINTGDCQARLRLLGFVDWDIERMMNQAILEWAERTETKIEKVDKKAKGIYKSLGDARRESEQQLRARAAEAEAQMARLQKTYDAVARELHERGLAAP